MPSFSITFISSPSLFQRMSDEEPDEKTGAVDRVKTQACNASKEELLNSKRYDFDVMDNVHCWVGNHLSSPPTDQGY